MTAPTAKVWYLTIDCNDPEGLAAFWGELLGVEVRGTMENFVFLSRPSEEAVALAFQKVPEEKVVKNRAHPDVHVERVADQDIDGFVWRVMRDPEGNEFCVVPEQ
jgi:hypothetical protein